MQVGAKRNSVNFTIKNRLILILLFFFNFVSAQNPPILSTTSLANPEQADNHNNNGNYAQDTSNSRDQYVGTWQYSQNGILFQLRIFKQDQLLIKREEDGQVLDYCYRDCIILKYKLVKNGVTLFDNLADNSYSFTESYGTKSANRDLYGFILDHTRNVRGFFVIGRLPSSTTPKLGFTLLTTNYTMYNDYTYYEDGQPLFSIPTDGIEMVKIN